MRWYLYCSKKLLTTWRDRCCNELFEICAMEIKPEWDRLGRRKMGKNEKLRNVQSHADPDFEKLENGEIDIMGWSGWWAAPWRWRAKPINMNVLVPTIQKYLWCGQKAAAHKNTGSPPHPVRWHKKPHRLTQRNRICVAFMDQYMKFYWKSLMAVVI